MKPENEADRERQVDAGVSLRPDIEKIIFALEEELGFGWGRASSIVDEIIDLIKAN